MNEAPVLGPGGAAAASLGRVAASGFWRVLLAGAVLVLAAIVVTMSGGAGLGGRLGSLFGLHTRQGGRPATAVQVAASAPVLRPPVVAREAPRRPAGSAPGVRLRSRKPAATGPQRTPAPSTQPAPPPAVPQPPPVVPKPPPVVPKPPPRPGGTVHEVARQVSDTAGQAVPAPAQPVVEPVTQPVIDQTVAVADQACGLIGGCP